MALPGLLPDPNVYDNEEDAARAAAAAAPIANSATGEGGGGGAPTSQQAAAAADDAAQAVPTVASFPSHSFTQHHEGGSSDTTRTTMDPRRQAAIADETAAGNQAVAATDAQGKAAVAKAGVADRAAQAQSAEDERYMRELAAGRAEKEAIVQQKAAEYQQRRLDMEKAAAGRHTTYWADKGAPAELLSIFLVGLSDRSHQLAGLAGVPGTGQGPSPVQQMLDAKMAEDMRIKLAKFEDSKEFMQLAKDDVSAAQKAKADKVAEIRDQHVVMVDALAKKFAAIGAKSGTADAVAKADLDVATLKQTNANTLQAQYKNLDKTTVAHSSKDSTTEVNNEKEKPAPNSAQKPNTAEMLERQNLYQEEANAREINRVGESKPQAITAVKDAFRKWTTIGGDIPIWGDVVKGASGLIGGPVSRDALLADSSPEARRVYELVKNGATAKAAARKGPITIDDVRETMDELGMNAKTPKEVAAAAKGYAENARRRRDSLEKHRTFLDEMPDPAAGPLPAEKARAAENARNKEETTEALAAVEASRPWYKTRGPLAGKELSAAQDEAVTDLWRAVKSGKDGQAEAQTAREAGAPTWMVDALLGGVSGPKFKGIDPATGKPNR